MGKIFKLTAKVSVTSDNTAALLEAIRMLEQDQVLVGVPAAKASRQATGPINNAALAYIHNYGSPTQNIPARPFLEPGIKAGETPITEQMQRAGEAALNGDAAEVQKRLNAAGIAATSAVKSKITQGPFAPLSQSTLAARRRRGRFGTRPLIDTGQLRNSINYVVRKRT